MNERICNKLEQLFNKLYPDYLYVSNYGYYLWVYKNTTNELAIVIHGYGEDYAPFEVILIKAEDDNTIYKTFLTYKDMEEYLKNDLIDELMVYGL